MKKNNIKRQFRMPNSQTPGIKSKLISKAAKKDIAAGVGFFTPLRTYSLPLWS